MIAKPVATASRQNQPFARFREEINGSALRPINFGGDFRLAR
jgi:hypothetical protein